MEKNKDFNEVINRMGTNCSKWDRRKEVFGQDVLPLWVADMDFKAPSMVIETLKEKIEHGVLGYTYIGENDYLPFVDFMKKRHHLDIFPSEILNTTGVVPAIALSLLSNTNEGDAVMIQTPVYHPFAQVIKANNRKLINNSLVNKGGVYCIDFISFEKQIIENDVKMVVLSNPHNPVGRVWMWEELGLLVDICKKHNVIIFSDEIHSDVIFYGNHFTSILHFRDRYDNIIAAFSPSKSFNVPSLYFSMIISPKESLRKGLSSWINRISMPGVNALNFPGAMAAYKYGEEWLDSMLNYVTDNMTYVINFFKEKMPNVKVVRPQGTYLMWLDFTRIFPLSKDLDNFLINEAKVGFNSGVSFGSEGEGFARINVACSRKTLEEALNRILVAFEKRGN
ncbi:MalY/PatB family protein [Clostridium cylindrosporum]|uniref:cysteine-S-conjugate beta-lyase n=1 Tax=Clostridium cylindrosporum DSM 605 TaxID=1121307 RepID=A0A0J8G071_CLOCY|nr:MalY/PatB family protein [Clostridium cylindrosporum]KMT21196.1 cystathionine beta-lyase PatB [Clostridium cylindrosporum DSM 605]